MSRREFGYGLSDKVGFLSQPSAEHSRSWLNNFISIYFNFDGFQRTVLDEATMLDVVRNGNNVAWFELTSNKKTTAAVMKEIIKYQEEPLDRFHYARLINIVGHHNVDAELLENIFVAYSVDKNERLLTMIAHHPKTPQHVLLQLLPSKELGADFDWGGKKFNYESAACFNKNTPVKEALFASQWLVDKQMVEVLWNKRFKSFLYYIKKVEGEDYSDYPMEWVQEFLWGKHEVSK